MSWTIDLRKAEEKTRPRAEDRHSLCRLPRVTRWMALALRIEKLVQEAVIANYAEAAALGSVTRARISQIVNLINLAPDIQEELLFMKRPPRGNEPILLADMQSICAKLDWAEQRRCWKKLANWPVASAKGKSLAG
ncbi:MAG: hypothetical protein K2X38_00975 [Gemmataceae bacterium]|nr:hypothetical protein [Gemmataceae bacterium]